MKKIYDVEIDCAVCAKKVEDAILKLDGVVGVSINFMTQKMIFEAEDDLFDDVLKKAIKTGKKIEPDFTLIG